MDGLLRSKIRRLVMPLLTLHPRGACGLCGCRLRGFTVGTYRINKNSMRSDSGGLSWVECPECGPSHTRRHPTGIYPACDTWLPDAASQERIDRQRAKRGWS